MQLLAIDIDETKNEKFINNPECLGPLKVMADYYKKVGYNKPWIGYFATSDGNEIVGMGGYKGQPKEGKVEISYGTLKKFEGKGVGTEICRQLVLLSVRSEPSIKITARTLPGNHASIGILKRNGFVCLGLVLDDEDGNVLEWEHIGQSINRVGHEE